MFKKKRVRCDFCGREVKEEWNYCPYCGSYLKKESIRDLAKETIEEELDRLSKIFGIKLPKIRFFPSSNTISITITSGNFEPGIKTKRFETRREKKNVFEVPIEEENPPKVTEEPKAKVKHLGLKDVIEVELPGVKSSKDIQIRELEQSIEIKARAGQKLYFKLLPIPPGRILHKRFSRGKLLIEIER